jgi:DNA-directed RNA polymerase subunit H (RpoH/RPB5)
MDSDNSVSTIFKSRVNILKQLESIGYDVATYNDLGIEDVNSMYKSGQLDMLLENLDSNIKTYVKFHHEKAVTSKKLDEYIEDLFVTENILSPKDNLVIITKDGANDTMIATIKNKWDSDGIYVSVRGIKTLQFNIFEHMYVPPHTLLSKEEESSFRTKYNIIRDDMIPEISRNDPVALALMMRPGEVCSIERSSKMAITGNFYRICV